MPARMDRRFRQIDVIVLDIVLPMRIEQIDLSLLYKLDQFNIGFLLKFQKQRRAFAADQLGSYDRRRFLAVSPLRISFPSPLEYSELVAT